MANVQWNSSSMEDVLKSYLYEDDENREHAEYLLQLLQKLNQSVTRVQANVNQFSVRYMAVRPYSCGSVLIVTTLAGIICSAIIAARLLRSPRRHPWALTLLTISMVAAAVLFAVAGVPLLIVENVFGYGWVLGEPACQAHRYLIFTSFYAMGHTAVLLMLYLTLAAIKPDFMARWGDYRVSAGISVFMWALIFVCNIPNLLGHGVSEEIAGISFCYHLDMAADPKIVHAWTILQFTFTFAIPLAAMSGLTIMLVRQRFISNLGEYTILQDDCYQRRQVATFGIALAAIFACCWAPDKILSLFLVLRKSYVSTALLVASDVTMILAYSYPLANGIVLLATFPDLVCVEEMPSSERVPVASPDKSRDKKDIEERDIITSVWVRLHKLWLKNHVVKFRTIRSILSEVMIHIVEWFGVDINDWLK